MGASAASLGLPPEPLWKRPDYWSFVADPAADLQPAAGLDAPALLALSVLLTVEQLLKFALPESPARPQKTRSLERLVVMPSSWPLLYFR